MFSDCFKFFPIPIELVSCGLVLIFSSFQLVPGRFRSFRARFRSFQLVSGRFSSFQLVTVFSKYDYYKQHEQMFLLLMNVIVKICDFYLTPGVKNHI